MKFKIPFTLSSLDKLRKKSAFLKKTFKHNKKSVLQDYLNNTDTGLLREEYLSICLSSFTNNLIILFIISTTPLVLFSVPYAFLISAGASIAISLFVLMRQLLYPKLYNQRKIKDIEKNLIPSLEDMLIQLNSGIPLYSILINLSSSDYGELSNEFTKVVKKINAGLPQVEVLEELGEKSPSVFFRRTLWQLGNGMRAGSDLSIVIRESIKSLNEEQLIQIQNYGNKLNPLIMFYMLISVIMPALSITFLTIISSLVSLPESMITLLFIGLFFFVTIIQVMFLGMIRSVRPSLL